ncbi:MAG: APC family permease [Candidatus Aminicenantes bacterium]|nr:APC family permease [Candidatus Aminicenantes bacterium]
MNEENGGIGDRIKRTLFGKPRNIKDPSIFHKLALIPILAWIGLGADGLSSASYGPEEAFKVLGKHTYLAVALAVATALTVFIGDAIFSFFPPSYQPFKTPFEILAIIFLVVINLRGIKESVTMLAPIFIVFILTHVLLIGYGILKHIPEIGAVAGNVRSGFQGGLVTLGFGGMALLFLRAFSMGGGTFTGIEAVSNGLQIMREPRVHNGKRTMVYLSLSLALTAGGILICYLFLGVSPVAGKTLNAVLAGRVFGGWSFGGVLALITIFSEGALLLVAAQTGFVDGPRVMANMAVDYWFPHRFASLSSRLTMQNGVLLMGGAAILLLLYSRGRISTLVVMYSINVFLTFSLSELGMSRFFIKNRRKEPHWKKHLPVHLTGLTVCLTILIVTTLEKFTRGGWLTLVITVVVVVLCYLIKGHYNKVRTGVRELDDMLVAIPHKGVYNTDPADAKEMTAIQLVSGYNGFGVHTFLSIIRGFPGLYKNFVFISVSEVDAGAFKGTEAVSCLDGSTCEALKKYVDLARRLGFPAESRHDVGIDVVETASALCQSVAHAFPRSTVFAGQTVFRRPGIINRILHNETAFAIQQELRWKGITTVILPIRINI